MTSAGVPSRRSEEREAHREVGLARGGRPADDDERRASVDRAPLPRRQARTPRRLYGPAASMRTSTMPPTSVGRPGKVHEPVLARAAGEANPAVGQGRRERVPAGQRRGRRLVLSVVVVDALRLQRVDKNRGDAPDALAVAGEADRLLAGEQEVQAFLLDCRRHVVGKPCRRRARAR